MVLVSFVGFLLAVSDSNFSCENPGIDRCSLPRRSLHNGHAQVFFGDGSPAHLPDGYEELPLILRPIRTFKGTEKIFDRNSSRLEPKEAIPITTAVIRLWERKAPKEDEANSYGRRIPTLCHV